MKSSTGAHAAPAFVDLKMPPPTLPMNITLGFAGSMTIDRTRPPTLPGPSHGQPPASMPAVADPADTAPPAPAPPVEGADEGDARPAGAGTSSARPRPRLAPRRACARTRPVAG